MWTETTRRQYRREDLRYASDVTDAEWALIEPHLPASCTKTASRRLVLTRSPVFLGISEGATTVPP
jgi:transposase